MKNTLLLTLTIILSLLLQETKAQDSLWERSYTFAFYTNYDLRTSSTNFISANRLINDGLHSIFGKVPTTKTANAAKGFLNFAGTYLTMLWSHEMGHYIRAKDVGGEFVIHDAGIPVPYTTANLPSNITLTDEAHFVTGGFEMNYLNVRAMQAQFIQQNGLWNEDLGFSFANRLMYTIYTTMIVPIDPKDPNVWIETAGDPVHYLLPVFENYSNNRVFMDDQTVNPDLVKLYNQATIFATFFQLLDPNFYQEVGASFGDQQRTRKPRFLIGDHETGWTYGTLFNASPLGYELYIQQYLHVKGQQFGLYTKYGRPYRNIGAGFSMNNVLDFPNLKADILAEVWDQDLFDTGAAVESSGHWKFTKHLGMSYNLGYKSEGYVLGKQLAQGATIGFGVRWTR